ncbi:MAG TPA: DUF4199 domain-containing protein [Saprospiraceae bacterium]|nr:DUF4199 domain-containing protein [Saprospiraceae bacterium]
MQKTILRYGLYSGALAALLMTITSVYYSRHMDFENGEYVGYAGILLSMLFVFTGVRAYREQAGGVLSFGKGFQVAISIVAISCLCYVLAWMVIYETLLPDFMDKYTAHMLEKMRSSGASEAAIQQHSQEIAEFKVMYDNPLIRFGLTFLEPFRVGILVALATAFILKKKEA